MKREKRKLLTLDEKKDEKLQKEALPEKRFDKGEKREISEDENLLLNPPKKPGVSPAASKPGPLGGATWWLVGKALGTKSAI